MKEAIFYINPTTDRPEFYLVAEHLWGKNVNIDSDGNSTDPADKKWTELTIINRSEPGQRIDIDPVQTEPLILKVVGPEALAKKAAIYLANECKCEVKTENE